MSDRLDAAKREQERTTEVLLDSKRQLTEAMDAKAGPPAESVDQAQEQLQAIRGSIERDLASLRERTPDAQRIVARVRPVAIAVGGGLATLLVVSRSVGKRRESKRHEEALREHATALAESFARLDLERIAAEAAAEREAEGRGGKGKLVALALGVAGAAAVAWARARTRVEPDIWGPVAEPEGIGPEGVGAPPQTEPFTAGQPAAPTDVTTEVPTIPVQDTGQHRR